MVNTNGSHPGGDFIIGEASPCKFPAKQMRVETRRGAAANLGSEDPAAEWARVLEERAVM
ncbi:MAG TPA: hypothetical protein PLE38_13530 [Usitatibacteraceae bacterium]|nr:hypothetical protein [Tepidiformaceae bacterium]HQY47977.1 hypothetical protein [Usitatibacteraceae bacterium]